jgi:hypothetical protein
LGEIKKFWHVIFIILNIKVGLAWPARITWRVRREKRPDFFAVFSRKTSLSALGARSTLTKYSRLYESASILQKQQALWLIEAKFETQGLLRLF